MARRGKREREVERGRSPPPPTQKTTKMRPICLARREVPLRRRQARGTTLERGEKGEEGKKRSLTGAVPADSGLPARREREREKGRREEEIPRLQFCSNFDKTIEERERKRRVREGKGSG